MSKFSNEISGRVYVAGGVNVDIGGTASAELVLRDSNPGAIHTSFGGVGRNIAHNMKLLGLNVSLLTAIGDDYNGQLIRSSCAEYGIDISEALLVKGASSSTYMFINGPDGDMAIALNDMRICDHLTPAYYGGKMPAMNDADAIVVDCNLPAESVEYIINNAEVPVFVDMVSSIKAVKSIPVLDKIHTIKANRAEAEVLSGVDITNDESLEKAANILINKGVKNVFISIGAEGMYVATKDSRDFVKPFKSEVVNTTGAGDCAMATLVRAYLCGLSAKEAALYANAAASIAIGSVETISPNVSVMKVEEIVNNMVDAQ